MESFFRKCKETDAKNASSSREQKKASAPDYAAGKTHSGLYDGARDKFYITTYKNKFEKRYNLLSKIFNSESLQEKIGLRRISIFTEQCSSIKERFYQEVENSEKSLDSRTLKALLSELTPMVDELTQTYNSVKECQKRSSKSGSRTQLGQTRFKDDACLIGENSDEIVEVYEGIAPSAATSEIGKQSHHCEMMLAIPSATLALLQ